MLRDAESVENPTLDDQFGDSLAKVAGLPGYDEWSQEFHIDDVSDEDLDAMWANEQEQRDAVAQVVAEYLFKSYGEVFGAEFAQELADRGFFYDADVWARVVAKVAELAKANEERIRKAAAEFAVKLQAALSA